MKFFEKTIELKTGTIFDFVCSALSCFVFAPIRLLQEISKKAVYMKLKELDVLFFTANVVGLVLTGCIWGIRVFFGVFDLKSGNLPFWVLLVGDCILITLYACFNKFGASSVYKSVNTEVKRELRMRDATKDATTNGADSSSETARTTATTATATGTVATATETAATGATAEIQSKWLSANDFFEAKPNVELLNSKEIIEYQNRLLNGIKELEQLELAVQEYSAEELAALKEKLSAITPPGKYVGKEFAEKLQSKLLEDEVDTLDRDNDDVPDDFTLYLK